MKPARTICNLILRASAVGLVLFFGQASVDLGLKVSRLSSEFRVFEGIRCLVVM